MGFYRIPLYLINLLLFIVNNMFSQENRPTSYQNFSELRLLEFEEKEAIINVFSLLKDQEKQAYECSRELLKSLKTDASKSGLNILMSSYFLNNGLPDSAFFYAKKAMKYNNFSSDSITKRKYIEANKNIIKSLMNKGLYEKSIQHLITGIDSLEKWGLTKEYGFFMLKLAQSYCHENKIDQAISLLEKTVQTNKKGLKSGSLMALGDIHYKLKNYIKSNQYYCILLAYNEEPFYQLSARLNIVTNSKYLNGGVKIIPNLLDIIKEAQANGILLTEKAAKKKLAEVYVEQKQYPKAKKILDSLLESSKKENNLNDALFYFNLSRKIAKNQGKYAKALNYSENAYEVKDSINKLQKAKEISELEVKFETLQKERENEKLRKAQEIKENEVKKLQIILLASSVAIFSFVILVILYYQKLKIQKNLNRVQKKVNNEKLNALIKAQELKMFKASIAAQNKEREKLAKRLHDSLGNDMATIKLLLSEVKNSKVEKLKNQLDSTYQKVREMSHNIIPKRNVLNDYTEVLKEYINGLDEIAKEKISLEIDSDTLINQIKGYVQNEIFTILQELITNTLKHAEAKNVNIKLEYIPENIHLTYEDDGKGFAIELLAQEEKGIGIRNIKSRVEELSGTIIIDTHIKRGTLYKIEFPVKSAIIFDELDFSTKK